MVTTAMVGHVLQLSVVARRRVMPGPGVCCVPDPTRNTDSGPPGMRMQPSEVRGCGADARSQSARASCGLEFTRCQQVLCPQRVGDPQVHAFGLSHRGHKALSWQACGFCWCWWPSVSCARRLRGPTTPGWSGRCGRDQPLYGCSTRRPRTGSAAIAASTWPERRVSRCTRPGRARWCSPGELAGRAGGVGGPSGRAADQLRARRCRRCGRASWSPRASRWVSWRPDIPAVRLRPACTGVRCGARRREPTTSIRSGYWPATPIRLKPLHR